MPKKYLTNCWRCSIRVTAVAVWRCERWLSLIEESAWLKGELGSRASLCSKVKKEAGRAGKEASKAGRANRSLRAAQEAAQGMPQLLDYVKQKAEVYELQQAVRNWDRKVEIAELALKRMKSEQNRAAAAQGLMM